MPTPAPGASLAALFAWLGRRATLLLFAGVFVGLALPGLAALLRPLLPAAVVVLLSATLLRLDWTLIGVELRRPGLQALLLGWHQLAVPLLVWAVVGLLPLPPALATALVLMAAAPPIMAAAALAALLGLEGALALVAALAATLALPLLLPPLTLELLGLEIGVGLWALAGRLGLLVGGALLLALLLRRLAGVARIRELAPQFDGAVVLALLVFVIGIMDGVTEQALAAPRTAALWLAAAWLANPLLLVLGTAAAWRAGRRRALTLGLVNANRNMGLLLAALPGGVDPGIGLFFALAQIPMYVMPALLKLLVPRLLSRGPPESRGSDLIG